MIDCTIKHRVKESQSGDATWCTGVVLGIENHSTKSSLKVVFQVRYEEDIDEIYCFPLLEDMQENDMFIINGL